MKYAIKFKRSKNGEFFWHIIHRNGKEIARSSETYKRRLSAVRSVQRFLKAVTESDYSFQPVVE